MAIVKSDDPSITTLIADIGYGPMAIYVDRPVEDITSDLENGTWVVGDSSMGEIHVRKDSVKAAQTGRREVNPQSVSNRTT